KNAGGGGDDIKSERSGDLSFDRLLRRAEVEPEATAKPGRAAQSAEHQVGVADGGACTAPRIAGRPGQGFGTFRPDPQRTAIVDRGDRPTAGTDGVDVERRQADRHLSDLGEPG